LTGKELNTSLSSRHSHQQKEEQRKNERQDERAKVTRFSVSLDPQLLKEFDGMIERIGYSRSTAIVTAMRNFIVDRLWEGEAGEVVGAITLMYDHHRSGVTEELMDIQTTTTTI
jgi:metal-responsive CopG/Arc/MetJ family transcriptional regulator